MRVNWYAIRNGGNINIKTTTYPLQGVLAVPTLRSISLLGAVVCNELPTWGLYDLDFIALRVIRMPSGVRDSSI